MTEVQSSNSDETVKRDTRQRRAIRRVFRELGRPLGPMDVVREGQKEVPTLGLATVYRNLKTLTAQGWLKPVDLPGEPPRYELAERPHHHHFVCTQCDQAYDIDSCPSEVESIAPSGFRVQSHEVVLYGLCPECP